MRPSGIGAGSAVGTGVLLCPRQDGQQGGSTGLCRSGRRPRLAGGVHRPAGTWGAEGLAGAVHARPDHPGAANGVSDPAQPVENGRAVRHQYGRLVQYAGAAGRGAGTMSVCLAGGGSVPAHREDHGVERRDPGTAGAGRGSAGGKRRAVLLAGVCLRQSAPGHPLGTSHHHLFW